MKPVMGELSASEKKLFECVANENLGDVKSLLKAPDVRVDCLDESGMTLLQQAAYRGNRELCHLFLSNGADVNTAYHNSGYTTLMFAALSGSVETTRLMLEYGAKTDLTNSIGRTATQMAAFVGQHQCVSLINNFFSKEDLDYYTEPRALEKEPKLPPHLASSLYKLILMNNMNPVKVVLKAKEFPELIEEPKVYKLLEILCEKMMKQKETNEVMAMKFHYLHCVMKRCHENKDKLDKWIKTLLKANAQCFNEGQEKLIRTVFSQFPYVENQLIQQIVRQVHNVQIGDQPSALDVLDQSINGQRMPKDTDMPCTTCGEFGAEKKCTNCKYANYCDRECQKLHWFTHKDWCAKLEEYHKKMEEIKKLEEEKERLEKETCQNEVHESETSPSKTDKTHGSEDKKPEIVQVEVQQFKDQDKSETEDKTLVYDRLETVNTGTNDTQNGVKPNEMGGARPKEMGGARPNCPADNESEEEPPETSNEDIQLLLKKGHEFLKNKVHQKAIDTFQKVIELDASCKDAIEGYRRAFMEDLADSDDIKARAAKSPQIQNILKGPGMRKKLEEMLESPEKLREHLQDDDTAKQVEKLMECALQD